VFDDALKSRSCAETRFITFFQSSLPHLEHHNNKKKVSVKNLHNTSGKWHSPSPSNQFQQFDSQHLVTATTLASLTHHHPQADQH